jgi:hypothetical protein
VARPSPYTGTAGDATPWYLTNLNPGGMSVASFAAVLSDIEQTGESRSVTNDK